MYRNESKTNTENDFAYVWVSIVNWISLLMVSQIVISSCRVVSSARGLLPRSGRGWNVLRDLNQLCLSNVVFILYANTHSQLYYYETNPTPKDRISFNILGWPLLTPFDLKRLNSKFLFDINIFFTLDESQYFNRTYWSFQLQWFKSFGLTLRWYENRW